MMHDRDARERERERDHAIYICTTLTQFLKCSLCVLLFDGFQFAGLGNMLFLFGLNVDSLPASLTATCFMPMVESSQNPSLVTDVALAKKSYHPSL